MHASVDLLAIGRNAKTKKTGSKFKFGLGNGLRITLARFEGIADTLDNLHVATPPQAHAIDLDAGVFVCANAGRIYSGFPVRPNNRRAFFMSSSSGDSF
jgi:hypothetical protein